MDTITFALVLCRTSEFLPCSEAAQYPPIDKAKLDSIPQAMNIFVAIYLINNCGPPAVQAMDVIHGSRFHAQRGWRSDEFQVIGGCTGRKSRAFGRVRGHLV